jgi:predicted permease
MNRNSISDIHHAIFSPLQSWAEQSTGNWNLLVGAGFVLLIVSVIFYYVCYRMIGQDDERTSKIFLKSSYCMLLAIIVCDIIFPKEAMWTIFFMFKYSIAILAGGTYLAIRYRKDFS